MPSLHWAVSSESSLLSARLTSKTRANRLDRIESLSRLDWNEVEDEDETKMKTKELPLGRAAKSCSQTLEQAHNCNLQIKQTDCAGRD